MLEENTEINDHLGNLGILIKFLHEKAPNFRVEEVDKISEQIQYLSERQRVRGSLMLDEVEMEKRIRNWIVDLYEIAFGRKIAMQVMYRT